MRGFFDTSVLVPVFYGNHVHHTASLDLFVQFDRSTGCCGAHSLAEVYSTLTRMPGKHRISAEQAMLFIGSIRERALDYRTHRRRICRCVAVLLSPRHRGRRYL